MNEITKAPAKSVGEDEEFNRIIDNLTAASTPAHRGYAEANLIAHIDSLLAARTVADAPAEPIGLPDMSDDMLSSEQMRRNVKARMAERAAMTTPPYAKVPGELTQEYAWEFARQVRSFVFAFNGQNFSNTESVDRMNLGKALDHLEECAGMIINFASRDFTPNAEKAGWCKDCGGRPVELEPGQTGPCSACRDAALYDAAPDPVKAGTLTASQMRAIAKAIAGRVAQNTGTAPELCFAPALFALQDSFGSPRPELTMCDDCGMPAALHNIPCATPAPVAADQPAHDVSVRDRALEEAAMVCDKLYGSGIGGSGCDIAAKRIRALRSQPAKGDSNAKN